MRGAIALIGLALLAACGSRNDDTGAVSPEEDRMLNDAAATLDVNYMAAPDPEFVVNDTTTSPVTTNATGNAQ